MLFSDSMLRFLLSFLLIAAAYAQDSGPLAGLSTLRNVESKRASSWDRSGGNADFLVVAPKTTATLAEITGAGAIKHMWLTIASDSPFHLRELVLRMYWDARRSPAWRSLSGTFSAPGMRDIVTGRHGYTSDLQRPGMLYGRVPRPESYGPKLVSLNSSQTSAKVVRDGEFVGVVGVDEAVKAQWKTEPQPSSKDLYAYLKAHLDQSDRPDAKERGAVDEALRAADHTLELGGVQVSHLFKNSARSK